MKIISLSKKTRHLTCSSPSNISYTNGSQQLCSQALLEKIGKICSLLYPLHPAPRAGCSALLASADCSNSTELGLLKLTPSDWMCPSGSCIPPLCSPVLPVARLWYRGRWTNLILKCMAWHPAPWCTWLCNMLDPLSRATAHQVPQTSTGSN